MASIDIKINRSALMSLLGVGLGLELFRASIDRGVLIDDNVTGLSVGTGKQQAADPSIVWDPKAKIWRIYFFARPGDNAEVYMVTSRDLKGFSTATKVLSVGASGEWDSVHAHKPCVVYDEETGKFYLFYSGDDGTYRRIGVAESDDGVNFTKYSGNPILEDPEGTGYLDAPSVFKWKDGNWYMYAYNGNGKLVVFKATSFPYTWEHIGYIDHNVFDLLSPEAVHDEDLGKIILLVNVKYPKTGDISEPAQSSRIGLFICEEPLKCSYRGILVEIPLNTRDSTLSLMSKNVFAPGVAKVGKGLYRLLFNAMDADNTERIFGGWLGLVDPTPYHMINTVEGITTSPHTIVLLDLAPGARAVIEKAVVYAWSGTPTEMYIWQGTEAAGEDNVIEWTNQTKLSLDTPVEVWGRKIGITVKGGSSTNSISIAFSLLIKIMPEGG